MNPRTLSSRHAHAGLVLLLASAGAIPSARAIDGDGAGLVVASRFLEGLPNSLAVDGIVAFAGLDTGLGVTEAAAPGDLHRLAHLWLPGAVLDVHVGPPVVAACGEAGTFVIDASDPTAPVLVSHVAAACSARAVAVDGSRAFVLESHGCAGTLRVIDLSDPADPLVIGSTELRGEPLCIAVGPGVLLVGTADGTGGGELVVLDVGSPAAPVVRAAWHAARPVNAIAVRDDVAFLATGLVSSGAVIAVDLSDPLEPRSLDDLALADAAEDIAVAHDGSVFVAASSLGVIRIDAADPGSLAIGARTPTGTRVVTVESVPGGCLAGTRSSCRAGGLVALRTVADGRLEVGGRQSQSEAMGVVVLGDVTLLLSRDALTILNTEDPRAPTWLSRWAPPGADFSVIAAQGGIAAIGDGADVTIVDVSDPARPMPLARIEREAGVAVGLALAQARLLVADGRRLEVFDVSDPAAPFLLAIHQPRTWASAVAARGSIALVAGGTWLETLDLAVPSAPQVLGSVDVGRPIYAIETSGDLAVAAGQEDDLIVLDISDLRAPRVISRVGVGPAFGVALDGTMAIVALGERGVALHDLSQPAMPRFVAAFDTSGVAGAVALQDSGVLVAAESAQHWLLQRVDPRLETPAHWARSRDPARRATAPGRERQEVAPTRGILGASGSAQ